LPFIKPEPTATPAIFSWGAARFVAPKLRLCLMFQPELNLGH
jgi:hypothetical protein